MKDEQIIVAGIKAGKRAKALIANGHKLHANDAGGESPIRVTVNSSTSGKFREEMINNRQHLVTEMMPIRADSTMNGILYPDAQVRASFMQLNNLPAPMSHPKVNGVHVSAFHPLAINAHNVGAFVRKPRMKGKEVFNELVIDLEVAAQTEDGQELVRRINEGEAIGVSTGLTIDKLTAANGRDDFGVSYNKIGEGFNFDHVALLLNETAAGAHAGTAVVNDDEGGEIIVCNMEARDAFNEVTIEGGLTVSELRDALCMQGREMLGVNGDSETGYLWIEEIFLDSGEVIFNLEPAGGGDYMLLRSGFSVTDGNVSLSGVAEQVRKVVLFETMEQQTQLTNNDDHDEGSKMDKTFLILSIIANAMFPQTEADKGALEAMTDQQLFDLLTNREAPSFDDALAIVKNSEDFDADAFENFQTNREQFEGWMAEQSEAREALLTEIKANSKLSDEALAAMSTEDLQQLRDMGKTATRAGGGTITNSQQSDKRSINFS